MILLPLVFVVGCTPEASGLDSAGADTGADSGGDSGQDSAADSAADSADTGDSGEDTGPAPLPGIMNVSGAYGGVPFVFSCTATDTPERFQRYWGTAVGDIAGGFACNDASSLLVNFIDPHVGSVTAPEGTNFFFTDVGGGVLTYASPTPTAWSLQIDESTFVDAKTMSLAGSLAGTWAEGEVSATFELLLPCTNCD